MPRILSAMVLCGCVGMIGCFETPRTPAGSAPSVPAPQVSKSRDDPKPDVNGPAEAPVVEARSEDATADSEPDSTAETADASELKLEGISFVVPVGWKMVKPQTSIVEAEFELPRAADDEYDGRLTLMPSGGKIEEIIANRTAEFVQDPSHGAIVEPVRIASLDATWVDLRGEWKGPTFRPIEPRPEYRMLMVIIPFTEHSAYYVKLTGPQETVAAHEEEFREFVHSAKVHPPGREAGP